MKKNQHLIIDKDDLQRAYTRHYAKQDEEREMKKILEKVLKKTNRL